MLYNTLNIVNSRYNPFKLKDVKKFLTPGEQTKFSNSFRTRVQNSMVSWNGGISYDAFELDTMFELKLFLSVERIEFHYILQQIYEVLAVFGGLMSSFMIGFKIMGTILNVNMILANSIELLYLVDVNELDSIKVVNKEHSLLTRKEDLSGIKPVQFSLSDKFAWIKTYFHSSRTPWNRYMTTR